MKKSTSLDSLDKRMAHLEKTMAVLNATVDNLATAMAKGFAHTASKQDLERFATKQNMEDIGDRVERSIENYTRDFRADYDALTARVKRLELTVFKR